MLKWTKDYQKEEKAVKKDNISIISINSDKSNNFISTAELRDSHSSYGQTAQQQEGCTSPGKEKRTLTDKTDRISPQIQHFSKSGSFNLDTGSSAEQTPVFKLHPAHQSSSKLSAVSLTPSAFVGVEASYLQIQLEGRGDDKMSSKSTLSSETAPKVGHESSDSTQTFSTTALNSSDIGSTENSLKVSTSSLEHTSAQESEHSQAVSSALPDITKVVPGTEREILGPQVDWEQENLTMKQVADIDNFPCVCFFEESPRENCGHWEFLSAGLKIYSRQPVLLHMRTKKKQARARTIMKDQRGAYYEVGQTLIIPDDYQGWFEVVPSDFSRATCFKSIDEVAKVMPRKFFTRSNIKGIRIEGEGENQKYLERKIAAGSVLETKGTFTAKWRTRAETGLFKKKTTEWEMQVVTYLKCVDRDSQEVLLPVTHKGKFNAIYEQGQLTQNAVYSMKDILSDLSLPVKVRLLFGKAPVVPCIFTGMLVVRNAAFDDAVVGSTILNTRNVLFEIPVSAPMKVKYVSKDEPLAEMTTYKDAERLCKKYSNMFSTMIKLSPDLDTDQKVIMHVPADPSLMRKTEEALRALDLITDISFTGEPQDHLLDSSDSGSLNSDEQMVMPKSGTLETLTEFKSRESHTSV